MSFEDNYKTKGKRRALVSDIEKKGIKDTRVLEAISKVPRHFFFDNAFLEKAYEDREVEMYWLKVEPPFEPLYDDPRWQIMLDKVGFSDE